MRKIVPVFATAALTVAMLPALACMSEDAGKIAPGAVPQAEAAATVSAKATSSKVKVTVKKAGLKGKTSKLVYMGPNEYFKADKTSGKVSKNSSGTKVASWKGKKSTTWTLDRVTGATDLAYDKFYVVSGSKIVAGPVYPTSTSGPNKKVKFSTKTKKGAVTINAADDKYVNSLGAKWTDMTANLTDIVLDRTKSYQADTVYTHVYNGKTYYFSKAAIDALDARVSYMSKRSINVTLIVNSLVKSSYGNYPKALMYTDGSNQAKLNKGTNTQVRSLGWNTSNKSGAAYMAATMEFLAEHYSQSASQGLVHNFVMGNEVDLAHYYYQISNDCKVKGGKAHYSRASLNKFAEEYSRTLRIANTAVKKYSKNMTVGISTTRYWAKSKAQTNKLKNTDSYYNGYSSKSLLDWVNKHEKARGNYDWTYSPHPYAIAGEQSYALLSDSKHSNSKTGLTGSASKSPQLTLSNLEILQLYLSQSSLKYKGKVRSVYITEIGVSSYNDSSKNQKAQAANMAMAYYRAANLTCVKSIEYWPVKDTASIDGVSTMRPGLLKSNGGKKLAYNVYRYIDHKSKPAKYNPNKYTSYLKYSKNGKTKTFKSYKASMKLFKSKFNWNKNWKTSRMTPLK